MSDISKSHPRISEIRQTQKIRWLQNYFVKEYSKKKNILRFSLMQFFTYFFQIVFNRNHVWIRCKILIWVFINAVLANGSSLTRFSLTRFSLTRISLTRISLTRFSLMLFITYFFQIVFNRNHVWIRCKILISVQGECRCRGRNHCCGRGDWIWWEWRGAERREFIWLPRPSSFLLLIHSIDVIGEISVRSRNCEKSRNIISWLTYLTFGTKI